MNLPEDYIIVEDENYIVKRNDLSKLRYENNSCWDFVMSSIGKSVAQNNGDLGKSSLLRKIYATKVTEEYELIENENIQLDDHSFYFKIKSHGGEYPETWGRLMGYAGRSCGYIKALYPSILIARKYNTIKKIAPRFKTDKPYPYGY